MKQDFKNSHAFFAEIGKDLDSFRDEFVLPVSKLFDEILSTNYSELFKKTGITCSHGSFPKVDIFDYGEEIILTAELAGFEKNDIKVEFKEKLLILTGKKKQSEPQRRLTLINELINSQFKRTFYIDTSKIDVSKIIAKFENCILTLTLPKIEPCYVKEPDEIQIH